MNAFDECRKTEQASLDALYPLLSQSFDGKLIATAKGWLAADLQKMAGDYVAERNNEVVGLEIKTEKRHTGNLFIETWSNKSRNREGWIFTTQADYVLYHFQDRNVCYVLSMRRFRDFCFTSPSKYTGYAGRLFDYREVPQAKHEQKNDTWGRLVPIDDLFSTDCLRLFWSEETGLQSNF